MKILAISADRRVLQDIKKLTDGQDQVSEVITYEGTLEGMTALPVKQEIDILMLDCRQGGSAELAALERMAGIYPSLSTMLIVDMESPELLLRALRQGVREVLKTPLNREEIHSALRRVQNKAHAGGQGKGRVVSFVSCKGGSGASFLVTNLGYVLAAQTEKRVLLIDLNLQFGDALLYVSDRRPSVTLTDIAREIQRMDLSLLKSAAVDILPNYGVLAAPDDPTHAMDIRPSHVESLIRFARANYDYVLLDVGRSLDTCSIQALDLSDHIYPVLQLTLPFLRDAKRLFDVFRSLDYAAEKIRPVLNRVDRSGELSHGDAEGILAYKIFASVPNHYRSVTASVNQGIPIMKLDNSSPVARSLQELATRIVDQPARNGLGILARLLGR